MAKNRTGKFWWESKISLQSMRGLYDPALSSDCRCGKECRACEFGNYCDLRPWTALSSIESWDEELLTSDGLPDGDRPNPDVTGIPFEERLACDINGVPYHLFDSDYEYEKFIDDAIEEALLHEEQKRQHGEECAFSRGLEDDGYDDYLYPPILTPEEMLAEKWLADVANELAENSEDAEQPINGYDHGLDDLPMILVVNPRSERDSKKEYRCCKKNGSFSHGWRGNYRYKDERKGKVRISQGNLERVIRKINSECSSCFS